MKQYLRVVPKTNKEKRLIPKWIKPWKEYEIIPTTKTAQYSVMLGRFTAVTKKCPHIVDEYDQHTLVKTIQLHLPPNLVQIVKPSQPRWTKDQKAFIDLLKKHNALQEFIVYLILRNDEISKHTLSHYLKTTKKESWMYSAFVWYELEKWELIQDEWETMQ